MLDSLPILAPAPHPMKGREVSHCAVNVALQVAREQGLDTRGMLDGLSFSNADLHDLTGQLDWDDFTRLLDRIAAAAGDEPALEEFAYQLVLTSPILQALAKTFLSPEQLLLQGSVAMGRSLYANFDCAGRLIAEDQLRMEYRLPESCRGSMPFAILTRGLYRAYPRLMGLPDAQVEAHLGPHQASFLITLPSRGVHRRPAGRQLQSASKETYLDLFRDPGGHLVRIQNLIERLSATTSLGEFGEHLMRILKDHFFCDRAQLWIAERSGDTMTRVASHGPRGPMHTRLLSFRGKPVGRLDMDPRMASLEVPGLVLEALLPFVAFALAQHVELRPVPALVHPPEGRFHGALQAFSGRHGFSNRESEILHLLLLGRSNKDIAHTLGTSPKTVENQVASMLRKSRAATRAELLAKALS